MSATEQWKPLNPEEKKRYDREFLLGFQFIFASMQKPEGLPQISDVVLDKVSATTRLVRTLDLPAQACYQMRETLLTTLSSVLGLSVDSAMARTGDPSSSGAGGAGVGHCHGTDQIPVEI